MVIENYGNSLRGKRNAPQIRELLFNFRIIVATVDRPLARGIVAGEKEKSNRRNRQSVLDIWLKCDATALVIGEL